jgi:phosphate transport system permease protein
MRAQIGLFDKKTKPQGEPFVWVTGTGLAVGMAMIVFLLGLVLIKGTEVFWPREVAVIELIGPAASELGSTGRIAGVITKQQDKKYQDSVGAHVAREWQLFLGNKDVYGISFKFFDKESLGEVRYPKDILRIERMEYGDAFGYPLSLRNPKGGEFKAQDPSFIQRLRDLNGEILLRWKEIRKIEKDEIGAINSRLGQLKILEKKLQKKGAFSGNRKEAIERERQQLDAEYQELAKLAQSLRAAQREYLFRYRLESGEEKEIPAGEIVDFYFPNSLRRPEKVEIFFKNIWTFLTTEPREANTEGGVFPAIFGTFVMTVLMSLAVTPFGVLAAIYLREYAKEGLFVRAVRVAINNLAGVPSIVFGVFGLGFFVYFVGGSIDKLFFGESLPTPTFGTGGIFWASLTLALLTVPVVIVAAEEALASVPRGMREGSFACGASKWQTIQRIVIPAAAPGILTGIILAMARGASEVAPLMLVGVVKLAPNLPIDGIFPFIHLERKFMHLGFHIYDLGFQSPESEAAIPMVFATTLLLITLVVVLNLGAIVIREHLRKKYALRAF